MTGSALRLRPRPLAALALTTALGAGTSLAARPAAAAVPAQDNFKIYYNLVEEDGSTGRQMDPNEDFQLFVNQARCQCGQTLVAEVTLLSSPEGTYDNSLDMQTYVGANCDSGEAPNSGYSPCVKLKAGQPSAFMGRQDIEFEMVWLSSPVESRDSQGIATAVPFNPCAPQEGTGTGLWICVNTDGSPGCQGGGEFIVNGSYNSNGSSNGSSGGTTDPTGMGGSGGISYDYQAPSQAVDGFTPSAGDGAIEIRWNRPEQSDIYGYRVLCSHADGSPVEGKGMPAPAGDVRPSGEIYYTADNLCPDAVKYEVDPNAAPIPTPTDGGDGSTGGTGLGDTGVATIGAWQDDPWAHGGTASGTGTGTGTAGMTGTDGSSTGMGSGGGTGGTGGSTGTTGSADSGGSGTNAVGDYCQDRSSGLCSLNWDYVCSDHNSESSSEIRVDGLRNGEEYHFLVVAYDKAGNPVPVSPILTATPVQTSDFWELCEQEGDLCGDGGFCHCRSEGSDEGSGLGWLAGLLLLGLGVRTRSRR